ncbi:MAG: porin family protein [Salegentibacter sp.]|uniref:Probable protein-translocating porin PorT n=1 Tax=Salegentibacter flavus TaxID=287099 RepID=A0A1I4YUC8_9FLAO|nr:MULTISPECIES: porin family protein [Salegentibacter]MDR9456875.1 porin family protein [Salegentibacter sp.]SFN41635.1 probable protein-translocating porin PorT [Salegentibacter flavus]
MRRFFLLAFFMLSFSFSHAQLFSGEKIMNNENFDRQRWSWGYFLGLNSYDFKFKYEEYDPSPTTGKDRIVETNMGFNVGLVGNLRLSNNLDLRLEPGVSFNTRGFQVTKADPDTYREINSTYVHIPLLLKFSTDRLNNFKPFVVGGVSTSINLSSNENNPDDNYAGQFRMTTNSYYYEIGFGVDLYLYYFKFSPSIRGVFAINDELIRDNTSNSLYTGNIEKMSTRAVFLNFTFQ